MTNRKNYFAIGIGFDDLSCLAFPLTTAVLVPTAIGN
jgi:hypothetical protein